MNCILWSDPKTPLEIIRKQAPWAFSKYCAQKGSGLGPSQISSDFAKYS